MALLAAWQPVEKRVTLPTRCVSEGIFRQDIQVRLPSLTRRATYSTSSRTSALVAFGLVLFGLLGLFVSHGQRVLGIGWSDLTAIRSSVPSLSFRRRIRVGSPLFGSISIAFE